MDVFRLCPSSLSFLFDPTPLVGDPVDPVGDPVDPVGDPVDPVGDPVDQVDPVLIPWCRFAPL